MRNLVCGNTVSRVRNTIIANPNDESLLITCLLIKILEFCMFLVRVLENVHLLIYLFSNLFIYFYKETR